ncbi:thiamine diphosphokinase [Flavimaricola marinus]|uniref:Thiamine diphosphokinase n=1 Tax=Flavimaricola marinus TaxID=1819565 RepID=A0A238LIH1_9RHOB|nr:thiamine diphosphokinase [Flavimaricola marinus]SMY09517.1 Thiamin pyrophosphokinase, catalytic domain [Flavimaricola marinus]
MTIVSRNTPVTLVGGSQLSDNDLTIALSLAPTLVAADGGAQTVLAAGLRPVAVIGDMDSISDAAREAFADLLHPVPEQETTDFDKALRHIAAPLVIALGVMGGRLDHELAMLNGLVCRPGQRCVALGAGNVVFLCPPTVHLDLAAGTPVSLFPMGPVQMRSEGLEWPTDGLHFAPSGRIGTSNAARGAVRLRPDGPGMLVILPREELAEVVRALQAPEACETWPARGG